VVWTAFLQLDYYGLFLLVYTHTSSSCAILEGHMGKENTILRKKKEKTHASVHPGMPFSSIR